MRFVPQGSPVTTKSLARFDEMRLSGLLPASAALLLVLHEWIDPERDLFAAMVVAAALTLGGLVVTRRPLLGRIMATAALAGYVINSLPFALAAPTTALVVWLVVLWLSTSMWLVPGLPKLRRLAAVDVEGPARLSRVRMSLRVTAVVALMIALSRSGASVEARIAVLLSLVVSLAWMARARSIGQSGRARTLIAAAVLAVLAVGVWGIESAGAVPLVLLALLAFVASSALRAFDASGVHRPPWWERVLDHPARQLVSSFLALIFLGSLLLGLPVASSTGVPVAVVDAAFTAVSAVCVTGLVVLDTPHAWSFTGQIIILVLIQLGGLGIMTFATAFLRVFGHRLSLRQEGAVAEFTSQENRLELYGAVKMVLALTFVAEALGTVLLSSFFFAAGDPLGTAVWRGGFTAISAFCNAGFALQSDSLVGYATHAGVLHVVAALIVLGGLSPAVILHALGRKRAGHLQTRLVLWTSAALLGLGTLLIAASEWNNVLGDFSLVDKLHNAWFQSVTLRTAGFNSVDFAALRPATITVSLVWMFIGGSPGGTAGGIKTTTFVVLLLAVLSTVRGLASVSVFGRTIPHVTVYRAASIATLGFFTMVAMLLAIQLTQDIDTVAGLFEVVSALGTVGLSMGATGALDSVGKIVVMVAMFMGRVGSLTTLVFLMARRAGDRAQRPFGTVDVG